MFIGFKMDLFCKFLNISRPKNERTILFKKKNWLLVLLIFNPIFKQKLSRKAEP